MGLLNNIAGAFNPRSPAAASPPPAPTSAVAPAIPPVTASNAPPAQQDVSGERPVAEQASAPAVVSEPQPQPQLAAPIAPATPASVVARADAVREISLHQFGAVRLQPAASIAAERDHVPVVSAEPSTEQAQAARAQPVAAAEAASIYTRAVAQLLVETGLSTQQRIMQSL